MLIEETQAAHTQAILIVCPKLCSIPINQVSPAVLYCVSKIWIPNFF